MAVGSVPVVLSAMGFTGTGIAASSIAANMMSSAAIANGGGVAAGSLVATLQSVGKCPGACAGRGKSLRGSSPDLTPRDRQCLCLFSPSMFSLGFSEGGKESWPGVCCVQVDSAQSGLVGLLGASPPTWGSVFFPGERGSFQLSV